MIEIYSVPKKATMKTDIGIAEIEEDVIVEETERYFNKDSEVLVIGLAYEGTYGKIYIIYSETFVESITVHEKFLDFGDE